MKLILLRSTCNDGRNCPNLKVTDRGTYLVQGETARGAVRRTDRGTLLVRGRLVVEAEMLRELNFPAGEAAVEIPINALPKLELAHAQ